MASEPQASAAKAGRAGSGRWLTGVLLSLLLVAVAIALAIAWLAATESGARYLIGRALQGQNGQVQVEGVTGTLVRGVQLERLGWKGQDQQFDLRQVSLAWHPLALMQRRLHVSLLSAAQLDITMAVKSSETPPALPADLRLPLAIQLDRVQIERIRLARGPLQLARLDGLALGLQYDAQGYRLQLQPLKLSSQDDSLPLLGQLAGEIRMQDQRPFPLQGRFTLNSQSSGLTREPVSAQGEAALGGSLEALDAKLSLAVDQAQSPARIDGQFRLHPFSGQVLSASQLDARGVDLAFFHANAPRTLIDARLQADQEGRGSLSLVNRAAGNWDARQLPLESMSLDFAQQQGRVLLERLQARLGDGRRAGGAITGRGSVGKNGTELALNVARLDLSVLHRSARKTSLAGSATLQHREGQDRVELDMREPGTKPPIAFKLDATLADSRVALRGVEIRAGGGELRADGNLTLDGKQDFEGNGRFTRFSPQAFGDFSGLPDLLLNGKFSLQGQRSPRLTAALSFSLDDSRLAGRPLQGKGEVALRGERLDVSALQLVSGENRLQVEGSLSPESQSGKLQFLVNAPRLDQLGLGWRGSLLAEGQAAGTARSPRIEANWRASRLDLGAAIGRLEDGSGQFTVRMEPGQPLRIGELQAQARLKGLAQDSLSVGALSLQAQFAPRADAPLRLDLQASMLGQPGQMLDAASLQAHGTTGSHRIELRANRQQQSLQMMASGGLENLSGTPGWRGELTNTRLAGRLQARQDKPAGLQLSAQRQVLERFRLDTDGGALEIETLRRDAGILTSRGRLLQTELARLMALLPRSAPVRTDLVLNGDWDFTLGSALSGRARLERVSGDITVLGTSQVKLGLSQLQARMETSGNRLSLALDAKGQQLGDIVLEGGTELRRANGVHSLDRSSPIAGTVRLDMPSIGWLGGLISPALLTEGRLQGELRVAGSLDALRANGQLRGDSLRVFAIEPGVDFRQGQLEAEFSEDQLMLKRLAFTGGEGSLVLSGAVRLSGARPAGQLALAARRYTLFDRADRRIVISGDSRIDLGREAPRIRGAFTIDRGMVDIGQSDLPQLSDDVVIVGQSKKTQAQLSPDVDISVGLGDALQLQGRGLDARLTGLVRLRNQPGEPLQAQGTVTVAKGSFTAYGRQLAIEQGSLRFTGPINNPALDILAMRRGQEVAAGVSVRGTALSPRVVLVSEPAMPDAEKLAWLVLGHGLTGAEGADLAVLQSAAAGLLTGSAAAGVQGQLASAFGVDTINLSRSQDSLQQRVVTVGKQVSSRLNVSVVQGLETATSALRLRYTLSPRLTVEAEAGTRSVFSLFYNIAFD